MTMGDLGTSHSQTQYFAAWALPASLKGNARFLTTRLLRRMVNGQVREKLRMTYGPGSDTAHYQDFVTFILSVSIDPKISDQIEGIVRSEALKLRDMRGPIEHQVSKETKDLICRDPNTEELCRSASSDISRYGRVVTLADERAELEGLKWGDFEEVIDCLNGSHTVSLIVDP